jgi:hypothetical protein
VTLRAAVLAGAVALALPAAARAEVPRWKVWLCHPTVKVNYCKTELSTTVVWADGSGARSRSPTHGGGSADLAYGDVLAAWRDYLAHWNRGRGVVLVGHSQGAFMLERLLRDRYGSIKHLLVSALLLGGDVAVGGDECFAGVPACRALGQTGCIVAYSTWGRTPPPDAGLEASAALPVAFPELYTARCVRQGETRGRR